MKKAVVFSLGCKVNQYEGQGMAEFLETLGYDATDSPVEADLYVINTCSVTSEADKKSRQAVARMLKLNPDAKVIVVGCSSQNSAAPYLGKPNVIGVGGVGAKTELIKKALEGGFPVADELPSCYEDVFFPKQTKTRGLIKIQDGCNNFCSYCRIPYLRGRSRSRAIESVVREAEAAVKCSKEIVLTGVDISSYGKDIGSDLAELMRALPRGVRKRLGSLECGVIDSRFLDAAAEYGFCDHFHLSLQSGSDTVLRRMNRHYTAEEYLSKLELIRSYFPLAGITTDVIAGFPGESDAEFEETVATVRRAEFSDIHVFPYSRRAGTKAYDMAQVADEVKTARAHVLLGVKAELKEAFLKKNFGRKAEVYWEEEEKTELTGFTTNYVKVYNKVGTRGELETVTLGEIYKEGVKAQ